MQIKGRLVMDGAGSRTIAFNSTGTVWKTSMFGFQLCSAYSANPALDSSALTGTGYALTLTNTDGVHPIAIYSDPFGCDTGNHGPSMNLVDVVVPVGTPCGSSAASIPCIRVYNAWDGGTSNGQGFQLVNSLFLGGGWQPVSNTPGGGGPNWGTTATNISGNVWNGFSCDGWGDFISDGSSANPAAINVTNNILTNPTGNCTFYGTNGSAPASGGTITVSGNGLFSTPSYEIALSSGFGLGIALNAPIFVQNNVLWDQATAPMGAGHDISIGMTGSTTSSYFETDQRNILEGGSVGGYCTGGYCVYQNNIGISSTMTRNAGCQGCQGFETLESQSGTHNLLAQYNVAVQRWPNTGIMSFLEIGSGQTLNGVSLIHNTAIVSQPDTGNSFGFDIGEGSGAPLNAINAVMRDNLAWGATNGTQNGNSSNTWNATACAWGGGVCNNWVAGSVNPYADPSTVGAHYDDGTHKHCTGYAPYGDICTVQPVWQNMPSGSMTGYSGVGPYRALEDLDKLWGGPGTGQDLANCMALKVNTLAAGAGITTSIINTAYCTPTTMYTVMSQWYRPLNINQANAASDATTPGAIQPLVMGSWIQ